VTEQDVLSFVAASLRSLWALEVLLLLRNDGTKAWRAEEIVRETRSSQTAVGEAILMLQKAGFVAHENGLYRYWPATPNLEIIGAEIQKLYAVKPTTVMKAILSAPHDKLRNFSDAFKLKE
jgi:hypothetical protein